MWKCRAKSWTKEIIEYHGRPDGRPILKIRILPDEEEFHEEEMNMVYKGIYVRQKLLFDGEIMEYEIWENEDGTMVKKAEGEVTCSEPATGDKGNRFTALNSMNLYLGMKDDRKLKESMTEYVTDSQIAKNCSVWRNEGQRNGETDHWHRPLR